MAPNPILPVPAGSQGQVQDYNNGSFGALTAAQLTALINPFSSSLPGAVPLSGGWHYELPASGWHVGIASQRWGWIAADWRHADGCA